MYKGLGILILRYCIFQAAYNVHQRDYNANTKTTSILRYNVTFCSMITHCTVWLHSEQDKRNILDEIDDVLHVCGFV